MLGSPNSSDFLNLGDHLRRIGRARDKAARTAAFAELAHEAEAAGAVSNLLGRLLTRDTNSQRFGLEVAARLTPPLPGDYLPLLIELLDSAQFPTQLRLAVAANIVRCVPAESPDVLHILATLQKDVSPVRAINRLRRLATLVPPVPALKQALSELDTGSAASCPRCGARVAPEDLVKHLWERHRLLLENGRVREPWDVIGQWLTDFARTSRPEYLDRSADLAQTLDPTGGLTRVHQLVLAGGTDDEDARALLRAEALEKQATLCPHCYALVPQPDRAAPTRVLVGSGRVDGGGFRVEQRDCCLYFSLRVQTPEVTLFAGMEPGHTLTRRGAVLLFLLPLIGLAVVFATLPPLLGVEPIVPVSVVLFAALVSYLGVRIARFDRGNPSDRVVDHAWTMLVPRLLQVQMRRPDAAFIAGLANASRGRGHAAIRQGPLQTAAIDLRKEARGIPYLNSISSLRVADFAATGGDDLLQIADEVGECFDGQLPLDHAERLIMDLRGDPTKRTRRARLRVLILARAFGAGLETGDMRRIGQLFPALGAAYASEDRAGLSRLRLLWLYRPRRLWQRVGSATTVFDLARYPTLAEIYLKQRPDLLLFQASGGSEEIAPILICEEGVVFRDTVITDADTRIASRPRPLLKGGGYELMIDEVVFRFREDPTLLARRLKEWCRFLFDEFLPRARLLNRRRSAHGDRLLTQKAVQCTECGKTFLGLTGDIGLPSVPTLSDNWK
jgi:hypothetical protein